MILLNSYFVNIAKHTLQLMGKQPNDHYQYLKGDYINSLLFVPVAFVDVGELIPCLRNKRGNSFALPTFFTTTTTNNNNNNNKAGNINTFQLLF